MEFVADCESEADNPDGRPYGHERKHNGCRAEIGGCVSGYTYISRDPTCVSQIVFLPGRMLYA